MDYMDAVNKWLDNLDKTPDKLLCEPGKDCNDCPLMLNTPARRFLYMILSTANDKFGDEFYLHVNKMCPSFTVCPVCRVDDFTHVEGCWLDTHIQKLNRRTEK